MFIKVEAETLEKAQEMLEKKAPAGLYLHHMSTTDWKVKMGNVFAMTMEEANTKIPDEMPKSATVTERFVLSTPRTVKITLEAADQASLQTIARDKARELDRNAEVRGMELIKRRSDGLLGMGKHLDRYRVEIVIPAYVNVRYRTMASIFATYGEKLEKRQEDWTEEDWVTALKKLSVRVDLDYKDQPLHRDPHALAKMVGENPVVTEYSICWFTRESKTDYNYEIYRVYEDAWVLLSWYEFRD